MIARKLTDYVIKKGVINKNEREVYEYGFTLAFEMGFSLLISFIIAFTLHMMMEAILFFVIFIPLRSYAGGLHLERYISCLGLSCLTFSVVLLIAKFIKIPFLMNLLFLVLLELLLYFLYPVENENRVVDNDENIYFKKKLLRYLFFDFLLGVMCGVLGKEEYLLLITTTFTMVVITMILGKYKNRKIN